MGIDTEAPLLDIAEQRLSASRLHNIHRHSPYDHLPLTVLSVHLMPRVSVFRDFLYKDPRSKADIDRPRFFNLKAWEFIGAADSSTKRLMLLFVPRAAELLWTLDQRLSAPAHVIGRLIPDLASAPREFANAFEEALKEGERAIIVDTITSRDEDAARDRAKHRVKRDETYRPRAPTIAV